MTQRLFISNRFFYFALLTIVVYMMPFSFSTGLTMLMLLGMFVATRFIEGPSEDKNLISIFICIAGVAFIDAFSGLNEVGPNIGRAQVMMLLSAASFITAFSLSHKVRDEFEKLSS